MFRRWYQIGVALVAAITVTLIVLASPAQDAPAVYDPPMPNAAAMRPLDSAPDLHTWSLITLAHEQRHAAWVARVSAYRAKVEAARKAAARAAQAATSNASSGSAGASAGGSGTGSYGSGYVQSLIARYFAWGGSYAIGRALCIGQRESGLNPGATNPNSGAAGIFQWLPSVWGAVSREAGWGGSSPYSATANVAVAGYWARVHGWSVWQGGSGGCGF